MSIVLKFSLALFHHSLDKLQNWEKWLLSFVMSVQLFVYPFVHSFHMEKQGSHWTDFHEIK
jgi:hypothetical protein